MKAKNLTISYTYNKNPTLTLEIIGNTEHLQDLTQCELLEVDIKPLLIIQIHGIM